MQTLEKNAHVRLFYDDFSDYLLNNQDQIVKEVHRYMLRQQRLHPKFQDMAVRNAIDRANRHRMPRTQRPVTHTKVPSLIQQTKDAQKAAMDAVAKAKARSKPTKPQAKRTKKPATPLYTKAKKLQNRKDLSKPPEGQSLLDSSPLMS